MSSYDIYVLILCLIVFASLTALFSLLITLIIRLNTRLVQSGAEDAHIIEEYRQSQQPQPKSRRYWIIADRVISIVLCCALLAAFGFSLSVRWAGAPTSDTVPTLSVVKTGSMAYKHEKNAHLWENDLNDQFSAFDIVLLYKLPPVEELELYDIVSYEIDGTPIIHRIVGIQPPNDSHSEYYFLLQGDAIESPDRFPVYYSQMRGIYRGQRIHFLGSFVEFLQSVAGWLCILLMLFGMVTIPLLEKKFGDLKQQRLRTLGIIPPEETDETAPEDESENNLEGIEEAEPAAVLEDESEVAL